MNLVTLFGRLHPLVIHFPIALMVVAAGMESLRRFWNPPGFGRFIVILLGIAAGGAFAAVATGWVFAHESTRADQQVRLSWHRWLGVTTAILNAIAFGVFLRYSDDTRPGPRWARLAIVWLAVIVLTVTAHLGALIVWGDDYFSA